MFPTCNTVGCGCCYGCWWVSCVSCRVPFCKRKSVGFCADLQQTHRDKPRHPDEQCRLLSRHMLCCAVLCRSAMPQALEHKSRGNELYKARKFDEALEEYGKAIELYDKDVSFLTNRCDPELVLSVLPCIPRCQSYLHCSCLLLVAFRSGHQTFQLRQPGSCGTCTLLLRPESECGQL